MPSTLFNLANVEARTGHEVDAIEHHRAFLQLAETDPRITDRERDRSKQAIADLLKKVGQIDIRATQGATISVDGKALPAAPTEPVAVSPGRHAVEATRNGIVRSLVVEPQAGQVASATLDFPESGATPPTSPPAESGRSATWSSTRIVTVSALAVAAVAGGVLSLVFRSSAQDNVDEAQGKLQGRSCVGVTGPNCTAASRLEDDRDLNMMLSTVSLIGGAAFAAAAITTAIVWPKGADRNAARLVPGASLGYAGLSFVGRF